MSLDSIRARVEAATPEPWKSYGARRGTMLSLHGPDCLIYRMSRDPVVLPETWHRQLHDASFIAHARTDVPLLLKVAEALRDDVKECAAWCGPNDGCSDCYQYESCRKRLALAELEAAE